MRVATCSRSHLSPPAGRYPARHAGLRVGGLMAQRVAAPSDLLFPPSMPPSSAPSPALRPPLAPTQPKPAPRAAPQALSSVGGSQPKVGPVDLSGTHSVTRHCGQSSAAFRIHGRQLPHGENLCGADRAGVGAPSRVCQVGALGGIELGQRLAASFSSILNFPSTLHTHTSRRGEGGGGGRGGGQRLVGCGCQRSRQYRAHPALCRPAEARTGE